jgi:uncharacterized membrane protein
VKTAHWVWGDGDLFIRLALPPGVVAFFTTDVFYGMPLSNWLGWYVTGVLISRLLLQITPPRLYAERVSPTNLPLALYFLNGIMPVAICFRDEMWLAAIFGAIAMAVPLALAVWAGRRRSLQAARNDHATGVLGGRSTVAS